MNNLMNNLPIGTSQGGATHASLPSIGERIKSLQGIIWGTYEIEGNSLETLVARNGNEDYGAIRLVTPLIAMGSQTPIALVYDNLEERFRFLQVHIPYRIMQMRNTSDRSKVVNIVRTIFEHPQLTGRLTLVAGGMRGIRFTQVTDGAMAFLIGNRELAVFATRERFMDTMVVSVKVSDGKPPIWAEFHRYEWTHEQLKDLDESNLKGEMIRNGLFQIYLALLPLAQRLHRDHITGTRIARDGINEDKCYRAAEPDPGCE